MKAKLITFTLCLFASIALLNAQEVSTHHSLTTEGAKKIADAAVAFAKSNGANPSIAIVDEGGHLLYFVRMDGSFAASANVSVGKARTSATFKKPTKEFEDIVNKGRFTMTALPDFTPLQGGVPIMHEGHLVGAIGVSGAKSAAQDEEVAKAGADALASRKIGEGPVIHDSVPRTRVAPTDSWLCRGLAIRELVVVQALADCQSAKQQSATLRYVLSAFRFAHPKRSF